MLTRARGLRAPTRARQRGVGLMEILISVLITSFGLLGLAGLQTRMGQAQLESYQRAQALTMLADLTQRIQANVAQSASYVTASALGTGDSTPASCASLSTRAQVDLCEWANALKGAAEKTGGGDSIGAMLGARGCVEQLRAENATPGVCQPAIYRVTVAWQGMAPTVTPAVSCGLNAYGADDSLRRAIASEITKPLPGC